MQNYLVIILNTYENNIMDVDLETLLQKINRKIIFYLPRSLFEKIPGIDLNVYDKIGLTSNLIVIKVNGDIEPIIDGSKGLLILSKEKDLKSNIFELLKMKGQIEHNALSFLLDNYYKELDTYITLSDYVKENAKVETLNYVSHLQSTLNLQHQVLAEHKKELKGHFGQWKTEVDLERIFGYSESSLKDKKINFNTNNLSSTKGLKKNKKPPLITQIEVDTHLLTSIFNVDLSSINNNN